MRARLALAVVASAAVVAFAADIASAQISGNVVKLGILNDQSGVYADPTGQGSVVAARMAVEEFGGKVAGVPVEVVFADHQNKPDVGASVARQWLDRDGVDAIVDVPTSSVALAVHDLVRERNRVFLASGAATSELTGPKCSPNTVHWTYDTWALANGTGVAVVKAGGDSWFFLTADYAFGHVLERDVSNVVKASGGKVIGAVRHPLGTADFSSFLLQAQASRARVIGLANAGGDTINSIKQAAEFGITTGGQKLAGLLVNIYDPHALGLPDRPGRTADRAVLLGSQRADAGLVAALRREAPRQDAVDDPRRGVLGGPALPQGGRPDEERRGRQGGGREDEGAPD
jgi:branched-chain amino acid transport system substrate-binding protein